VLGGELWRGVSGVAGEIGHIPVDPAGPVCPCGQRGCLELYASGSAVARQWPSDDPLPVRALFDAAASGDAVAAAVRDRLLQGAAEAARLLVLTVDVDDVVIGGGISRLGEPLIAGVRGIIARWEADSPFVASLRLGERVRLLPPDFPAAAVGAAFVGDPEANAVEVV
jgi:predicted NBD/HSP70 family sugar kinase